MADKNARFRREIATTEGLVDSYVESVDAQFSSYIRDTVDDFNAASAGLDRDALLAQLRGGNFPTGLEDKLNNVLSLYTQELNNLKGRFRISASDTTATTNIATVEAANIRSELRTAATSIASTMAFTELGGGAVVFKDLQVNFLEGRFNRINAGLNTNLAGYRSGMEIRKADQVENVPLFAYIGPRDNKNRPFCRFVLDESRLWSLEEINELDNNPDAQLLPVFVYGGGYDCRHRWVFTKRR